MNKADKHDILGCVGEPQTSGRGRWAVGDLVFVLSTSATGMRLLHLGTGKIITNCDSHTAHEWGRGWSGWERVTRELTDAEKEFVVSAKIRDITGEAT